MALAPTVGLILHFRHQEHTNACLVSLLSDGITQVVVVDNSADNGASVLALRPAFTFLKAQGMNIVLCEPGRNLGFSAGVNYGLAQVRERFGAVCVLLINNDARLKSGAHCALLNAVKEGAGLAVPTMQTATGKRINAAYYHRLTGLLFHKERPGAYEYLSGCCMLLSAHLATPPLFDEDFFFYGDDTELGWRLSGLGIQQHKVIDAVVEHEGSIGSRNGSFFYEYHMVRAHWVLARKLAESDTQHFLFLIGRAVTLPARALLRSARHRSTAPLRGFLAATWDVFRGRRRTLTPRAPQ
ncbi:glycosyltransferase family 2 protein [Rhodocyclaceae bacterium SMB388]